MEKVERECSTKLVLLSLELGKDIIEMYCMKIWAGKACLIVVPLGVFFNYIKIRANQTPFYLAENLLPLRGLLHLNTNPHTFRDIPCKTNRYKNSFFPNAVNSWNNSVSSFQDSIKIHITYGKLKFHVLFISTIPKKYIQYT